MHFDGLRDGDLYVPCFLATVPSDPVLTVLIYETPWAVKQLWKHLYIRLMEE